MKLLMRPDEIAADPARWLNTRRQLIGASEIGSILGLPDAYSTPFETYWQKTTGADTPDNLSMRIGRELERVVLDLFTEQTGVSAFQGGLYAADGRDWQAATFDALGDAFRGPAPEVPIQAKTTSRRDGWGEPPDGDIPGPYLAQCLQEIDVADSDQAFLPVLFLPRGPLRVYRILRDSEDDILAIREAGEEFHQRLTEGRPPPVDWRPETTRALKRLHARTETVDVTIPTRLAERARAARVAVKRAERQWGLVENELRARLAEATRAVTRGGDVIVTRSVYEQNRIDAAALRQAHPGIAAEFTHPSHVDKLIVKQPKIGD